MRNEISLHFLCNFLFLGFFAANLESAVPVVEVLLVVRAILARILTNREEDASDLGGTDQAI